jgi:hypothetical protein
MEPYKWKLKETENCIFYNEKWTLMTMIEQRGMN